MKKTVVKKRTSPDPKPKRDNPLPIFPGHIGPGVQVVADTFGVLYRIDAQAGTIELLRWA